MNISSEGRNIPLKGPGNMVNHILSFKRICEQFASFLWHLRLRSSFWWLKKSPDIYCLRIISWCKKNFEPSNGTFPELSQNLPLECSRRAEICRTFRRNIPGRFWEYVVLSERVELHEKKANRSSCNKNECSNYKKNTLHKDRKIKMNYLHVYAFVMLYPYSENILFFNTVWMLLIRT